MAYKKQSPQPVVEGGTGAQTLNAKGVLLGNGASAITATTAGINGELLIGSTGSSPAFASPSSANGTIVYTPGAGALALDVNAGMRITSGFSTFGGAGNYFDDTTLGSFTVLRPGTGYINSKPISWTAPQTVTGLVAGNTYFIYIDNTGTIGKTTVVASSIFQNNIVLFKCMRDSTAVTNNQITTKQNRVSSFQIEAMFYEYRTIGPVIENTLNGANITLSGTKKIIISGTDVLNDCGLISLIQNLTTPVFKQVFTLNTGKWATYVNSDTFGAFYNNAGTVTAITAGNFGVYTLYLIGDNYTTNAAQYFAILNGSQYTSLSSANDAIAANSTSVPTGELASLKLCRLGYIIYSQASDSIVQVTPSKNMINTTQTPSGITLPVTKGGTGTTALTEYAPICGGVTSTSPVQSVASIGTAGQILTSNGAAALPTFQNAPSGGITTLGGDSGSATGATVNLNANSNSGSSVKFTGAGATVSFSTTDAGFNTIIGSGAGNLTGTGTVNTALGHLAFPAFTTGLANTAIGTQSLNRLTTGLRNTAIGDAAATSLVTGWDNICLGVSAGSNYTGAEGQNICIGNGGVIGDNKVIRIGRTTFPEQTSCYIVGIDTVNVGSVATVVTEAGNKLGTAVITAGTGITVTPGANTITITNSAPAPTPFTWAVTTVNAALVINNGYIANKVGLLTMTLPATGAIGDVIEITNMNTAVGWRIAQNANQYIRLGSSLTTTGIAGYLEATALGDSVKLVCMVAGASTGWICTSVLGNVTIV